MVDSKIVQLGFVVTDVYEAAMEWTRAEVRSATVAFVEQIASACEQPSGCPLHGRDLESKPSLRSGEEQDRNG